MWWYFLGTDGGPVVNVFRGSLRGDGVDAGLDWTVLCLRPTCGILARVVTPLGVLSPPFLLVGPHRSWGGLPYSPLPSPSQQEERACLTHFSLYCLRAKEGGRRKTFSLPAPLA